MIQLLLTGLGQVDFGFPDPVTVSIKMNSLLKINRDGKTIVYKAKVIVENK